MQEILLNTFSGDKLEVSVIRYFEADSRKYLVYTLNEKDAENYLRLYVGSVAVNNGRMEINIISNENEWANVKALFKGIIAANREGRPVPVRDLNTTELATATLNSYRVFKLLSDMAAILGENNNSTETAGVQKTVEPAAPAFDFGSVMNPVQNEYQAPVEPTVPSYAAPVEEYEMPTPTPSVVEFTPEVAPVEEPQVEEPVRTDNNEAYELLKQQLEEAQDKMDELMLENAELKSKLETIKLLLK